MATCGTGRSKSLPLKAQQPPSGPLWLHEIEYDGEFARPHKWPGATGSASGLALYPFSMSQCNSRRRLGIG